MTNDTQPQVILHAEHLVTEDNRETVIQGVSHFCNRLAAVDRNIQDQQAIVPLATELYVNFANLQYQAWGKEEEAKAVLEEATKGFSLAVLGLRERVQREDDIEVGFHQALAICINDDTKTPLVSGEYPQGEMEEVSAKGIVLVSFDPILPVHFTYLLTEHTKVSLLEEGVSVIVVMGENGNIEIAALTNKEILEQIEEYKTFLVG